MIARSIATKRHRQPAIGVGLLMMLAAAVGTISCAVGQNDGREPASSPEADLSQPYKGISHHVDIWSDGTRLSGDLFYPESSRAGDKLPAIILCHGWGGLRSHLNTAYAPLFAQAGYVVLTFDYRGWADSDSRLVIKQEMPKPDEKGMVTVKAQAIRELVDPFDQVEDITSAIDFIAGEPRVDKDRIGLWGTSFAGGHVVYVAAHDKRVKCIVSQVPSMDGSWVNQYYDPSKMATQRARGEIDPVPQGVNEVPGLRGTPYLARIAKYRPVDFADRLKVPILIIVAEKEELMDNAQHGKRVYNIVKDRIPAQYEVFAGTHFEIYSKGRTKAAQMAVDWFDRHLKNSHHSQRSLQRPLSPNGSTPLALLDPCSKVLRWRCTHSMGTPRMINRQATHACQCKENESVRHHAISTVLNFVQVSVRLSGIPSTFTHWETPKKVDGYRCKDGVCANQPETCSAKWVMDEREADYAAVRGQRQKEGRSKTS